MIIEKKIWPQFFERDKTSRFNVRLADFNLREGDVILFKEWDPKRKEYTGREFSRRVTSVTKVDSPTRFWTEKDLIEHGLYLIELGE